MGGGVEWEVRLMCLVDTQVDAMNRQLIPSLVF